MGPKLAPAAQDNRDGERFPCEVPTTCQPPSAYTKDPWPATIRDISTWGLSLTLNRRFERGSGLAIELPTEDGTTATVLARVAHVRPYADGGWVLGCEFISELSDEEVQLVLTLDPVKHATMSEIEGISATTAGSVSGVLFQTKIKRGGVLRWYVKRLELGGGGWPLTKGKVVSMRVGGLPAETPALDIRVRDCRRFGSYWIVEGKLSAEPNEDIMHALLTAPTMGDTR
jgi:hypothetical protein